jgi:hypothetical protein
MIKQKEGHKMKTRNLKLCLFITVFVIILSASHAQESLTAREIIARSQEVGKLTGSESIITLRILNKQGRERVRKISSMTKLDAEESTERRIILFIAPADVKGTGMLIFDYQNKNDHMWLYMPALRKTRRIVSSDKSKSFMGSEFSNADISTPNLDDYHYTRLSGEVHDDTECWKIEALPINDDIADLYRHSKKVIFIGKKDFVARRVIYYDFGGEIWKELLARDVQLLDVKLNKYQAMEITMINRQNGRKSVMKFDKLLFNPDVNDNFFTIRFLEKAG